MSKKESSNATKKARDKKNKIKEQHFIESINQSIIEDRLTYHELFNFLLEEKKYYSELIDLLDGDLDYNTNEVISIEFIEKKVKTLIKIENMLDYEALLENEKVRKDKIFPIRILYTPMGNKR